MIVLCVSHSERSFLEARCDINYLEKRFPENRLDSQINFDSIKSIQEAVPYNGSLSIWKINEGEHTLSFLKSYSPKFKVQFASFFNDFLFIYGSDRIEVLNNQFECVKTITGPEIAGGHTLHFDNNGYAWINSAPGNSIMKVDIDKAAIVEKITLPSMYGKGFASENIDIKEKFIPTDLQPTHVNCVFPHREDLYVTLWIPGAIGMYNSRREYKEILSGFRGLHSAKIDKNSGLLYFTDSPSGIVWFYDLKQGKLSGRFKFDSRWVHDADHIENDIYVAGLSDENTVQIFSTGHMKLLHQYQMNDFGKSVMFLNCCKVNQHWEKALKPDSTLHLKSAQPKQKSSNIIPQISNPFFWKISEAVEKDTRNNQLNQNRLSIVSKRKLTHEYLVLSELFTLPKGKYRLQVKAICRSGGISVGIVTKRKENWVIQFNLDTVVKNNSDDFSIQNAEDELVVVFSSNNPEEKENLEFSIEEISLEPLFDMTEELSCKIIDSYDPYKGLDTLKARLANLEQYASDKEKEVAKLIKSSSSSNSVKYRKTF